MALEDLCKLIETVRCKSQQFGHLLSQSEALTRYVLIDPILRSLGWDTENPETVRPEYSPGQGSADYALFENNQPLAFVEAKSLGQSLQQGVMQSINYCIQSGTKYFIITDGLKWEIYETHKQVPLPDKRIADFDLAKGDVKEAVLRLLALWKVGTINPVPLAIQSSQNIPSNVPLHGSQVATPQDKQSSTPLISFLVKRGDQVPKKLIDPNGIGHPVKVWKDILIIVVEWLVQQGLLTTSDCPIKLPKARLNLINVNSKHPSGDDFSEAREVPPVWIETKASAPQLTSDAQFLIQQFGKGRDFYVVP